MTRIGIDLGGTKIEGIALDAHGAIVARLRVDTPRAYAECIDAIANLVHQLEAVSERGASVGIGIPGVVVPSTGLVKNANSVWLNGQPLQHDLERTLSRHVRIMNDANCFALSEATDGAAAGADVVFGVILGTGVGGGIVVHGACLQGANLIAGEWGHNPLPWPTPDELPGPSCYCGRNGCIEAWLSGPAFEREYATRSGDARKASEIVQRAHIGDASARNTLAEYHDRLGRALATTINLLDPDVIVLGGGMSNVPGLAESAAETLAPWVFSSAEHTRVVRNVHGDSSGVRGAAWLWPVAAHA